MLEKSKGTFQWTSEFVHSLEQTPELGLTNTSELNHVFLHSFTLTLISSDVGPVNVSDTRWKPSNMWKSGPNSNSDESHSIFRLKPWERVQEKELRWYWREWTVSQFKCFLKNKKEIFKKKNKKNIPPPFALFVSEALSRGLDLPRLKRAKFVNSVLKVEQVSLDTFAEMFNHRLFF